MCHNLIVEFLHRFNPYFSGFRSYTLILTCSPSSIGSFQSLFQWIPVLYLTLNPACISCSASFNPYFSGFRSYTNFVSLDCAYRFLVSILISVDSGLIHLRGRPARTEKPSFNPYFSGFRSYTRRK